MAAFEVVHCLKNLTQKYSMTIVASIHAPNQQTLDLFNKIYVLAKGGVCIYGGALCGVQQYLEQQLGVTDANKAGYKLPSIEKLIKISCNGKLKCGKMSFVANCFSFVGQTSVIRMFAFWLESVSPPSTQQYRRMHLNLSHSLTDCLIVENALASTISAFTFVGSFT